MPPTALAALVVENERSSVKYFLEFDIHVSNTAPIQLHRVTPDSSAAWDLEILPLATRKSRVGSGGAGTARSGSSHKHLVRKGLQPNQPHLKNQKLRGVCAECATTSHFFSLKMDMKSASLS